MSSRRNNPERLGAPHMDSDAPPTKTKRRTKTPDAEPPEEDLFSFVTPTEFVELPSGGRHYPEDSHLHGITELEIRHMTAKEEDILTSEALLRKGIALDRLLQSMLVDKRVKVGDLLVGDKNALLLAARITGFGSSYDVSITCPVCDTPATQNFDLDSLELHRAEELPEGVKTSNENTFIVTLPMTKLDVEVKLLTSTDEKGVANSVERARKSKQQGAGITTQVMRSFTVAVNDRTDRDDIAAVLSKLPVRDSRFLRKSYEAIVPNVDMTQHFACDSCGHDGEVAVPMTAEFFWPES